MDVEGGRDAAHQEPQICRHGERSALALDNAVGDEIAQARGGLQHRIRRKAMPIADGSEIDGEIAHDAFDDLGAQAIVG
ncbi:hypothetical protein KXV85_003916, partial [Aspergillus fumigatus]